MRIGFWPFTIFAAALGACASPTEPGVCRNGRDDLGRGPTNHYVLTCAPEGLDVRCTAQHSQVGYCADSTRRDVTASVAWISSDPSVGEFLSPGFLKVLSSGQVEISAKAGFEIVSGDYAYDVAPGLTPERLAHLLVVVSEAGNPDRRVANARIDVRPTRGPSQTGQPSTTGSRWFWIFAGPAQVQASMDGYESAETTAPSPLPNGAFTQHANLDLRRIR
jgi:hypothetical protein